MAKPQPKRATRRKPPAAAPESPAVLEARYQGWQKTKAIQRLHGTYRAHLFLAQTSDRDDPAYQAQVKALYES